MKIGLLIIATNNYTSFVPKLISSADSFFLKNHDVTYFLFSNFQKDFFQHIRTDRKLITTIVEHKKWPYMTLERYKIFNNNKSILKEMDYLYYCDSDMLFCSKVEDEILSELVATRHPGTLILGDRMTPETNPKSTAFISEEEKLIYCAGGFNGGTSEKYLNMSVTLSQNIDIDLKNGIIAKWHDESHMNRYFIDNPPSKILSPSYCYPENWNIPFEKKILALEKNHKTIR